jgi:4-diphosphocytidyl-2-C-methyl-D-erythritol kinase
VIAFRALSKESGPTRRLVLNAAAKVNLVLEVLGKREDGYHELVTVMQAVDLSDKVTIEDGDVLELESRVPGVPTDGQNLALRAATALCEAAGITRGARITLDKRIPVAAGLGGGSADAAAVLVGLNRLWRLRWSVARLEEVGTRLGMDVPFFLHGGRALATGRGERIERLRSSSLGLVLVNPRFAVSTAEMYGRVAPEMYTDGRHAKTLAGGFGGRTPARVAATLYNGLQEAAVAAYPQIGRIRAALLAAGALGALMSGSGPTVFGVARSFEHARQIRRRLTRGAWDCWAVRTLNGPAIRMLG